MNGNVKGSIMSQYSRKVFSRSSHRLTSLTNFLWKEFTLGFNWKRRAENKVTERVYMTFTKTHDTVCCRLTIALDYMNCTKKKKNGIKGLIDSRLWTQPGPALPARWHNYRPSRTEERAAPGTPPRCEIWSPCLYNTKETTLHTHRPLDTAEWKYCTI